METANEIGLTHVYIKMNTKNRKTTIISRATTKPALKITLGNDEVEQVKNVFTWGSKLLKK